MVHRPLVEGLLSLLIHLQTVGTLARRGKTPSPSHSRTACASSRICLPACLSPVLTLGRLWHARESDRLPTFRTLYPSTGVGRLWTPGGTARAAGDR
jgi:hypothetical protein